MTALAGREEARPPEPIGYEQAIRPLHPRSIGSAVLLRCALVAFFLAAYAVLVVTVRRSRTRESEQDSGELPLTA